MSWLSASWSYDPGAWIGRLLYTRALAVVYLVAFLVALNQFRPLSGTKGILPVPRYVSEVRFSRAPSLFHLHYSDRFFEACCWVGIVLAAAALGGGADRLPLWGWMLLWLALWVLYLSIVNVGQVWYRFGWESLLLESGFLAIFLGPASVAPPRLIMWLLRWLLFRLEFGAGLIKLRGDECWRNLTCLYYHHETQPMPNPASWYFHHLPPVFHRAEVFANHATQLVVIVAVFAPQPVATIAAAIIIVTQCWLMLSGNFSWLNALTITVALSIPAGNLLHHVLPVGPASAPQVVSWLTAVSIVVTAGVVVLSYWPVHNMVSRRQIMNATFNPFHLVNTYGAFGHVTRRRYEVIVEGSDDPDPQRQDAWRAYEFKGKPGDPFRRPPQVAPYHLRLDWVMWFVGISPAYGHQWLVPFLVKLLEGDRPTLRLLRSVPFADPPRYVRARLYHYRFTTRTERKLSGAWWHRTSVGELVPPISLRAIAAEGHGLL